MQPLHSFMPITVLQHSQQVLPRPMPPAKSPALPKRAALGLFGSTDKKPTVAVLSLIHIFVKRLGSRDAVSRRFFVIFQYEAPTNERNISYAEIVSTLETTARNFRTYLAQCGNALVEHENEDEFLTDVFYTLLNRRTAVPVSYTHLDVYKRQHQYLARWAAIWIRSSGTFLPHRPCTRFLSGQPLGWCC